MALFALWQDEAGDEAAARLHGILQDDLPIVAERITHSAIRTQRGCWQLSAYACATHFYSADAQVLVDGAGNACVIHGLVWRVAGDTGMLMDARAIAALLSQPGMTLPDDIAGEYAILRVYPCGTLEAFGDPAGLHHIFYSADGRPILGNRAGFVASIAGLRAPDAEAGLWLGAIGYRAGNGSSWSGVRQLGQGERLAVKGSDLRIAPAAAPLPRLRGYDHGGDELLCEGLDQAKAAIRLAAGDGTLDLPITGGKDSRAVLAVALAAGLRNRLTLFTRGYADHPDVVVGAQIAARIGVPHRREPPLGSDLPPDLSPRDFLRLLATIAWQADGVMGGWDNVTGRTVGTETIVSGHLGEVLKAYAKRLPEGPLDAVGMVRLQAPFDPMALLREPARARLVDTLSRQMAASVRAGAEEADLPDLFYWQNRVPNWLGGIRSIKSFERQPILPLGVPALMRLAFQMTAGERKAELAHYRLIAKAAPELIDLPFAHQSWDPGLGAPSVPPVLAPAGSALFGSWQWSINRVPAVRASLIALFAALDIPLWNDVDRARLIEALRQRRFDYFDGISLLGFAVGALHQAGLGLQQRLGGPQLTEALVDQFVQTPELDAAGHLDAVTGAANWSDGTLRIREDGIITFSGWVHLPEWPGATPVIEARVDGRVVAAAAADLHRADLAQAGIGDGHHGFRLTIDAASLTRGDEVLLAIAGGMSGPAGGRMVIR
ncbi:hypothetical protein [Sphingomonas sp.]|uniref:hypothetical protein n=1 Tax=Sphingomonas sp. TaxID=28214 RepID=UPI003B3B4597